MSHVNAAFSRMLGWRTMDRTPKRVRRVTEVPSADAQLFDGTQPRTSYDDQELQRLWEHGIHEDNMFFQQGNFFLVAESMLLVAYAAVLSSHPTAASDNFTAVHVISGFGLALTGMWALISHRHMTYHRLIRQRMLACFREFHDTRTAWQDSQGARWRKVDSNSLVSYGVTGLAGIMWLLLLTLI
jgi:hypothetical protein